jgi:hypothetical protein
MVKKYTYSHHKVSITHPLTQKEITLNIEARVIDGGIGPYEFWGAKGVHSQEELEWFVDSDESGRELTQEEEDAIYNNEELEREITEQIWKEINT